MWFHCFSNLYEIPSFISLSLWVSSSAVLYPYSVVYKCSSPFFCAKMLYLSCGSIGLFSIIVMGFVVYKCLEKRMKKK